MSSFDVASVFPTWPWMWGRCGGTLSRGRRRGGTRRRRWRRGGGRRQVARRGGPRTSGGGGGGGGGAPAHTEARRLCAELCALCSSTPSSPWVACQMRPSIRPSTACALTVLNCTTTVYRLYFLRLWGCDKRYHNFKSRVRLTGGRPQQHV